MTTPWRVGFATALLLAAFSYACGSKPHPKTPEPSTDGGADASDGDAVVDAGKPLFERLGGADGVKLVVEKFLENVKLDTRLGKILPKLKGDKLEKFKASLIQQICDLTNGANCEYKGKDMKSAHKGLKITEDQFDFFLNDLKDALLEAHVADTEVKELLDLLTPFKDDVVEVKKKVNGKPAGK
jgi:hemoglobin